MLMVKKTITKKIDSKWSAMKIGALFKSVAWRKKTRTKKDRKFWVKWASMRNPISGLIQWNECNSFRFGMNMKTILFAQTFDTVSIWKPRVLHTHTCPQTVERFYEHMHLNQFACACKIFIIISVTIAQII